MTQTNFCVKPWRCSRGRRLWKFYSVNLGRSFLSALSGSFATSLGFCQGRALRLSCYTSGERGVQMEVLRLQPVSSPSTLTLGALVSSPGTHSGLCTAVLLTHGDHSRHRKLLRPSQQGFWVGWACASPETWIRGRGPSKASRGSEVWGRTKAHRSVLSSHPLCFLFLFLSYQYSRESFPLPRGNQHWAMIFFSNNLSIARDSPLF